MYLGEKWTLHTDVLYLGILFENYLHSCTTINNDKNLEIVTSHCFIRTGKLPEPSFYFILNSESNYENLFKIKNGNFQ